MFIYGHLDFSGAYAWHVDFQSLNLPLDSGGKLYSVWSTWEDLRGFHHNGDMTLVSAGNLFRFNPYSRVPPPELQMRLAP